MLNVARGLMAFMNSWQRISLRTEVCWHSVGIYTEEYSGVLSATALENMFNPFSDHRNDQAALAATMSKRIVDDHGGDIKIASQEGVGTTVIIELPIEIEPSVKECPQSFQLEEFTDDY